MCFFDRCILDRSTVVTDNSEISNLSTYERVLSVLYSNYVRAQVEFTYQIDQLTSRVRSMENCRRMKEPFNPSMFNRLLKSYEQELDSWVIICRTITKIFMRQEIDCLYFFFFLSN